METDIRIIDVVDSTNTVLESLAEKGAPEGTCVISFCQTKGQGRSGRAFFSPEGGNLYMSLLLRPKNREVTEMITVMSGVATVRALRNRFGIDAGIKWVNDIIYDGRKICGMVAVGHGFGGDDPYVILGIGVNIYESGNVPEDITDVYGTVMKKRCEDINAGHDEAVGLAKDILAQFGSLYDKHDFRRIVEEYRRYSVVIGEKVEYLSGDEVISATVVDIGDDCGIVLESDGILRTYRDGEIRIRMKDL